VEEAASQPCRHPPCASFASAAARPSVGRSRKQILVLHEARRMAVNFARLAELLGGAD
jgi:hypothetical protein